MKKTASDLEILNPDNLSLFMNGTMIGAGFLVFCIVALLIWCICLQMRQTALLAKLKLIDKNINVMLWESQDFQVKHDYLLSPSREHRFTITVTNTLPETILLTHIYTTPPGGRIRYCELAKYTREAVPVPQEPERIEYSDKVAVRQAVLPCDVKLRRGESFTFRYATKFRDGVIMSNRPPVFICYSSCDQQKKREYCLESS